MRVAVSEIPADRQASLFALGKVRGDFLIIPNSRRADYEREFRRFRGLGDLVEVFAKPIAGALGIKDCNGCESRKATLNKAFPL